MGVVVWSHGDRLSWGGADEPEGLSRADAGRHRSRPGATDASGAWTREETTGGGKRTRRPGQGTCVGIRMGNARRVLCSTDALGNEDGERNRERAGCADVTTSWHQR